VTARHSLQELPPTLVADRVGYRRAGRAVLDDVSVSAYPHEVLAITGPSGSGKSSLLALLAGLEPPDSGTVTRTGAQLAGTVPQGYGLVLQGYGLVSVLSAAENVEIVLQGQGLDRNDILDRAEDMLAVLGLDEVADHLVEQLSGGQQQRVAIARALVIEPAVLLADELTAELDHASRQRVLDRVFGLADTGSTVVICTHDPEVAARCHRQIELTNGRLTSSR
jgi:ABC-type lipoprotein export system ATPase subunit